MEGYEGLSVRTIQMAARILRIPDKNVLGESGFGFIFTEELGVEELGWDLGIPHFGQRAEYCRNGMVSSLLWDWICLLYSWCWWERIMGIRGEMLIKNRNFSDENS